MNSRHTRDGCNNKHAEQRGPTTHEHDGTAWIHGCTDRFIYFGYCFPDSYLLLAHCIRLVSLEVRSPCYVVALHGYLWSFPIEYIAWVCGTIRSFCITGGALASRRIRLLYHFPNPLLFLGHLAPSVSLVVCEPERSLACTRFPQIFPACFVSFACVRYITCIFGYNGEGHTLMLPAFLECLGHLRDMADMHRISCGYWERIGSFSFSTFP